MARLLELLKTYGSYLYLLVLQVAGLQLLIEYNDRHASVFDSALLQATGRLEGFRSDLKSHLTRNEQNLRLQQENIRLRTQNDELIRQLSTFRTRVPYLPGKTPLPDSLIPFTDYRYVPCRAISNELGSRFNYLTLNVGRVHGVEPQMGVLSGSGAAGMVVSVSDHFSRAISLLNQDFRLSARLRRTGVYGSFSWEGSSTRRGQLNHIPVHFDVLVGDTVDASGYSTLFPEGTLVGIVRSVSPEESSGFHRIEVELSTDFHRLDYLYVVESLHAAELDSLARKTRTGQ